MSGTSPKNIKYQNRFKKKNPNRSAHLEKFKWKPGQSGNPNKIGYDHRVSITNKLQEYLRHHPEELEKIVIALVKQGVLGNIVATKEMFDRVDGKVVETHRVEGDLPVIMFVPASRVLSAQKEDVIEGQATELLPVSEEKTTEPVL